jgi:hypothetical protein
MVALDLSGIRLKLQQDADRTNVFDPVRRKWVALTPEEHIRQLLLGFLTDTMHYPLSLMAVERMIMVGNRSKRFDIVIYDRNHTPWMLVECKSPDVPVTDKTLEQLLSYHSSIPCPHWLLTNGHQTFCADASDTGDIKWLRSVPEYV